MNGVRFISVDLQKGVDVLLLVKGRQVLGRLGATPHAQIGPGMTALSEAKGMLCSFATRR